MNQNGKCSWEEKGKDQEDKEIELKEGEVGQSGENWTKCSKVGFVGMALHNIDKYRTIYFKGVDSSQVNKVLDNLKGINIQYKVSQVMLNGFTKVMSVMLSAVDADQVTKAHELIKQCYSSPGKFCPEHTYNKKEVS